MQINISKTGLTEKGRQMLRDAANPDLSHQYSWYVIQDITRADQRVGQALEEQTQGQAMTMGGMT